MTTLKIKRNRAKCALCGDEIESKHRHDFQQCSCGEIFTDGGQVYVRQGAYNLKNLIDLSEYEDDDDAGI